MALLYIKIFLVRILDVSLGTVRMILLVKGKRLISSIVGFIEISIWFSVVREALNTSTSNIWIIFAYAGGFAAGTYIGGFISDKFIKGTFGVQIITNKNNKMLVKLRENGYAVSAVDVSGIDEKSAKYMLFIEIDKKHLNHLQNLVKSIDKKAFIVVTETKYVQNGYFKQI